MHAASDRATALREGGGGGGRHFPLYCSSLILFFSFVIISGPRKHNVLTEPLQPRWSSLGDSQSESITAVLTQEKVERLVKATASFQAFIEAGFSREKKSNNNRS